MTLLLDHPATAADPATAAAAASGEPDGAGEFARIVDALTRRRLLGGALGTVALTGLAACGGSATGGTAAAPASPGTRTVTTVHGETALPSSPNRIVATDFPEVCALLDLGIVPAGRTSYLPDFAAYTSAVKDVPVVDTPDGGELVVEKIAALRPDLIVGDDWADPAKQRVPYQQLARIAPTAIFAWEQAAGNWPTLAAQTAAAVGKTAALEALKRGYGAKAGAIRSDNAALFGRTRWDIIDCSQNSWDLYSANSSHGQVLTGAGVPLGAGRTQTDGYVQYSFERFGILAGTDVIVTTPASLPYLRTQRLYQNLPAVKAGRVYTTGLFFPASYGIAVALLDDLATICAKVSAR